MDISKEVNINSGIDEKLKTLGPTLDLTQGPPINQKRTVTFVNHFIISMVEFLNKFAQSCEYKLFICDQKIKKLEDELCLLEAKLNSIPEIADHNCSTAINQMTDESTPSPREPELKESNSTASSPDVKAEEPKEAPNPEVAKYLKMVQVGVPIQAVRLKMQQEGLDPSLLQCTE